MEPPPALVAWARKADQAQGAWDRKAVDSWAAAMEFSRPLQWGESERAVLERDYPPLPGRAVASAIGALGWAGLAILAVLTVGSPVIGLSLVVASSLLGSSSTADELVLGACYSFVVAIITALTTLSIWWHTRRRGVVEVVVAVVTLTASATALGVYLVSDVRGAPWLPVFAVGALACGLVVLVLGLVSKPEGRARSRRPPPRGPRGSDKRARALRARKRLLQVLIDRRLVDVDQADQIRLAEMPLGYWSELDGQDDAGWRTILEQRHIGWREFDKTDRRPR